MGKFLALIALLMLIACGARVQSTKTSEASTLSSGANCPANTFDPKTIDELMATIAALPKPIELECILKSLKRPLAVYATTSKMSVQPAVGPRDPRIFIFRGNLVLSFVTSGEGSLVLEFSQMKSDVRSIKGEIPIPIVSNFRPEDAFSRIITSGKTSCSGCHSSELSDVVMNGVQLYSSKALKPTSSLKVSLVDLQSEYYLCASSSDKSRRCAIYSALFSYGPLTDQEFPADTPTLLSAF